MPDQVYALVAEIQRLLQAGCRRNEERVERAKDDYLALIKEENQ